MNRLSALYHRLPSSARWPLKVLVLALTYYLTGRLGMALALPPGYATAVWPPSGVALAGLLLGGFNLWPGILLGEILSSLSTWSKPFSETSSTAVIVSLTVASGATLQSLTGCILVRRLASWPNMLSEPREIGQLLFLGGFVATLINATIGSFTLWMVGIVPAGILLRHWATWWCGDMMGVFVFTPLLLLLSNPFQIGRRRLLIVAFWVVCSFSVAITAVTYTVTVERDKLLDHFEQTAAEMSASLQTSMEDHLGAMQAMSGFYAGTERRGLGEFTQLSRRLREQVAGLQSIQWAPHISESEKTGLENWARDQGLNGFFVVERGDGRLIPVRERPDYVPITLVEPMTGNMASLGVDLPTLPDFTNLLTQARDDGQAAVSSRLRLVQGDDGAAIVYPLYENGVIPETVATRQATLRGYIIGMIRLRAMVRMAFESKNLSGIDYWLIDDDAHDENNQTQILAANNDQLPHAFELDEHGLFGQSRDITLDFPLLFGGRHWRLQISPNADFMAQSQATVNWVVLFGGVLLSAMVGLFVMVTTGRELALRRQIESHTSQFRRQNESLRLLNNIAAMPAANLNTQLRDVLNLGMRHLALELGIVSRIEGGSYFIEQAVAAHTEPLQPGLSFPLGHTYCALTLEHGDALAIDHMSESAYSGHPSYQTFQLESYIGAPILVHGRLFGTVSFTSSVPYNRPFDDGDLEFIRLMARWLGAAIEREEAQEALMSAHRRLAAILDNTPVGIAIVGFDRVVMQANPTFCAIFNQRMDQVVGRSARALYPSDEIFDTVGSRAMPLLASGRTFDEDVPMARGDGGQILVRLIARTVDSGDRNHGIVWAAEDVTERRSAESALRERQEFYEQIFTSGAAVKLLLDPQSGKIVDANPAAAAFYGLPLQKLCNQPIWTLDELEEEQSLALLRSAQADVNSRFVYRHRLADGSHRDVEVFTGPMRVRDHDLVLAIVHDVTDRLQSEHKLAEALREREAQAKELARSNAELEQFAYVASHDLRQPLRQVASYVSLLERMYAEKLDEEGRQFIGFARSGAERMDRLIVDLLEYSRIGRKTRGKESVAVLDIITEPVRILTPVAAEAGGSITIDLPENIGSVTGERMELERLMQNLIGNALKYRSPDRPPMVNVTASRNETAGELTISITDNGIGIREEHFARIFGIFQRLHGRDEYEGTGIGLAVCKKIVDHHKGRIWLDSKPGKGTVFHVALPLAEGVK